MYHFVPQYEFFKVSVVIIISEVNIFFFIYVAMRPVAE